MRRYGLVGAMVAMVTGVGAQDVLTLPPTVVLGDRIEGTIETGAAFPRKQVVSFYAGVEALYTGFFVRTPGRRRTWWRARTAGGGGAWVPLAAGARGVFRGVDRSDSGGSDLCTGLRGFDHRP